MVYAVIDTNVLVSAYITHNQEAATLKVLNSMFSGKIMPLYNDEIWAEYNEVLSRKQFHISEAKRETLFSFLRVNGIYTERTEFRNLFIDESDRVFYEVMLSEEDSFLVTGNLKHFPTTTRVVTPAQMLEILEKEKNPESK